MTRGLNMKKEKAIKLCKELWAELERRSKYWEQGYMGNMEHLKRNILKELYGKYYYNDCPFCDYSYIGRKLRCEDFCLFSVFEYDDSDKPPCYGVGYNDYMSKANIKEFNKIIQDIESDNL